MLKATLTRFSSSEFGTKGILAFDGGFTCKTLELMWNGNMKNISCVPTGTYKCDLYPSSKFGLVYVLEEVPNRTGILIHAGNFAGAKNLGHKTDVEGCILVGEKFGVLDGQPAILNSRKTLLALKDFTDNEPFELTILDETSKK